MTNRLHNVHAVYWPPAPSSPSHIREWPEMAILMRWTRGILPPRTAYRAVWRTGFVTLWLSAPLAVPTYTHTHSKWPFCPGHNYRNGSIGRRGSESGITWGRPALGGLSGGMRRRFVMCSLFHKSIHFFFALPLQVCSSFWTFFYVLICQNRSKLIIKCN